MPRTMKYDEMQVTVYDSNAELGEAAAGDLAELLGEAVTMAKQR